MIKFLERTKSKDEEHVDERAYPFFSTVYGKDGWVSDWDSTKPGLRVTKTVMIDNYGTPVCAYCGRVGLPIQDRSTLNFKGHCCVCKDAMDEVEIKTEVKKIKEKFDNLLEEMYRSLPEPNEIVLQYVIERKAKQEIDSLAMGFGKPTWMKITDEN